MKRCVYIHIPFCESICSYCDFCKMFYNEKIVNSYLCILEKEIKKKYQNDFIKSIYIGGGSPTCLSIEQLKKLFSIIKIFKKEPNMSFTIEGNFENITEEKLALFKENNVNRLSFGIESIDEKNLAFLERNNDLTKIRKIINLAKELSFDINVDLMYALPTEDMATLNKDLDFIESLNINHCSTYSLIIEDHTKLKIKNIKNISEDLDFLMYQNICKRMQKNGYIHYEISNFCKEGHQSIHNLCYWKNEEYYGFGLGASSYLSMKRMTNTKSINNYLKENFADYEEILSLDDEIDYEIILNLRLKEGLSLTNFFQKYGLELKEVFNYEPLLSDDLIVLEKDRLFISEEKWYISNEIIRRFLEGRVKWLKQ